MAKSCFFSSAALANTLSYIGLVDRPTQLIYVFYLLSWWWQPLWSGGLLFQWRVLPKNASQVWFFSSKYPCHICTWRQSRSRKWDNKMSKTKPKPVCPVLLLQRFKPNLVCRDLLLQHIKPNWEIGWEAWKNRYFGWGSMVFAPFNVSWSLSCIYNPYFAKRKNLIELFYP